MPLTIGDHLKDTNPRVGLVDNGDTPTTYRITVEDVNSDEVLAAVEALVVGTILAAGTAVIGRTLPLETVETPFTGAGNVVVGTHNITPGAAFKLEEIELHLSAAPTTGAQNLVVTLDDGVAAAYDLVILTIDLVANAVVDLVISPDKACKATDVITAAWTNTDGRTFGLKFKHQLI